MLPDMTAVSVPPSGTFVEEDKVRLVLGDDDPQAISLAVLQAVAMLEGLESRTERFFRPVTLIATSRTFPRTYDGALRLLGLKSVNVRIDDASLHYDNGAIVTVGHTAVVSYRFGFPYVCWPTTAAPGPGFDSLEVTYSPVSPIVPEDMKVAVMAYAARLLENPSSAEEAKWKEEQAVKMILELHSAGL